MNCRDIGFGTYLCSQSVKLPDSDKLVNIDNCLIEEVRQLWRIGIKTTGCCCGHDKETPYIGVYPEYIDQMIKLGYDIVFNSCRPMDKDSFLPKSRLKYK